MPTITAPPGMVSDPLHGGFIPVGSNPSDYNPIPIRAAGGTTQTNQSMPNQQFWPGTSVPYLGPGNIGASSSGTVGTVAPVPAGAQQNAVQQNLATAPDLTSLTSLINQLNLQGQQAANAGRIPGEAGLEAQSSANIGQQLAGQVPQDVVNLLQQQGAERGVATGMPGSANSNAAYLQALGLTSLGQQQAGQANLSAAAARNPVAKIFDPTSMLLTPYQSGMLGVDANQLALEWYKALHPNVPVGGGGGGGQQPTTDTQNQNWWRSITGGTPAMPTSPPTIIPNSGGTTTATTPGGSSETFSNTDWSQFFGNPYGDVFPNPAATNVGVPFGTVTGDTSSSYDPFSLYTGGAYTDMGGGSPVGTVTSDTSSTYDPFAQYGDWLSGG